MVEQDECPFCLSNGLLKGRILFEDDLIYFVAPEIEGIVYAGGMVVTKRHIATPFEMSTEEWKRLHDKLPTIKALVDSDNPDGYNLGWNVGKVAGQNVDHAHMHFFGRFADEPLAGKGIRYAFKQDINRRP